ncbi:glycosyltransferase [Pontibacter sp. MBLB2868]|uniref:glycosyltransferase n=1 Tax=Pontibacter sp. MBLB2868 TaxID=3451555 RepID=UPI003F75454B
MEKNYTKPRLVFFQWDHKAAPLFIQLHMQLQAKCLAESFDLVIINKDCDYQQVCDTYQPDLTLFESGYRTSVSIKPVIKNTSTFPEIPKIGFHNGDPWCDCRPSFISDMEHWGIGTFFSISTTMAEHTPEIAENLFIWPNFIDDNIYRDYGQLKLVPILFNGSRSSLYPWRQKIYNKVSNFYPSLIFPHLGYENNSPTMIYGEQYARTINASWFVPACGTVGKEVVRKHFEVPGSKACLISEKSPSLEAAGFADMQNCVFADDKDILDKLDYLFENRCELGKIINAGHKLVHSRHTLKQRGQIFQWFSLQKSIKSNERIIQLNPFEPLKVVKKESGFKTTPIICEGLHLELLRKGDEKLWAGKYEEAEVLFLKCQNIISYMHEPKLKLTICNLYKGNAKEAFHWITEVNTSNFINKARDSDPVEWAYLIITLLCQGKLNEALIRAHQFPYLNHIILFRIRWAVECLNNDGEVDLVLDDALCDSRYSIHKIPPSSFVEWISNLCTMLRACKQFSYAETLIDRIKLKEVLIKAQSRNIRVLMVCRRNSLAIRINCIEKLNQIFGALNVPAGKRGLPSIYIYDFIYRILKLFKMSVKKVIVKFLLNIL